MVFCAETYSCKGMVTLMGDMMGMAAEVLLIDEDLGL